MANTDRDGMLAAGMETGVLESKERLDGVPAMMMASESIRKKLRQARPLVRKPTIRSV